MTPLPHDTEVVLGRVLTAGTRLSSALLAIGLVVAVTGEWRLAEPALSAGLLVLMATPIARVAVSIVEFARGREWWVVVCASFVLLLLAGSLIVAIRG